MKRFSGFICGFLVTVLVLGMAVPGLAALTAKTIEVYTGVTLYLDDQKFSPKDANGNEVEVLLHNGTTYLPVRAIGEAYGKDIAWDDATKSAYIGYHAVDVSDTTLVEGDNPVYFDKSSVKSVSGGEQCTITQVKFVGLSSDEAAALKVGSPIYLEGLDDYDGQKITNIVNDWYSMTVTLESGEELLFSYSQVEDNYTYLDEFGSSISYAGDRITVTFPSTAAFVDFSTGFQQTHPSLSSMLANSQNNNPHGSITVKNGEITAVLMYQMY